MAILLGIFEEGLIYAIMALGVYITYKILDCMGTSALLLCGCSRRMRDRCHSCKM